MRITNRMMTNNMLSNISTNKNHLSRLEEQYSTGMKIQKPSDDPIVAVRALKLRTNLSELNQYYEKNIPDAKAWMDITESALTNVDTILSTMNTYCVQGAQSTLTVKDRNAIAANLKEMKTQILDEGNANYAGRYVFTGFKTDTSLVFDDNTSNFHYTLTEKLDYTKIGTSTKISNSVSLDSYDADAPDITALSDFPSSHQVYRIRLAYNNLLPDEDITINLDPERDEYGDLVTDDDGNIVYKDSFTSVNVVSKDDENAFMPEDGTVNFIAETGELILAQDVYTDWTKNERDIHISYSKNTFNKNDLKPEHYFDCVRTEYDTEGELDESTVTSFKKENQIIEYEVNFNQKLQINTQGSDAITHDIGRMTDEILEAIDGVVQVENKLEQVKNMLADKNITDDQKKVLNKLKEQLDTELTLRTKKLTESFSNGIAETKAQQTRVGVAISDLGSRYVRLQLTESRLSTQQDDFTELLSSNEDADLVDTIINYTAAETVYNSSLSAAAKVVQNSLLDFL